jgi:hypothetical protein
LGTLNGYAFGDPVSPSGIAERVADANSLQLAFWFLEQEVAYSALDSQAKTWVTAALNSGFTGLGNVHVLNLFQLDANGKVTAKAQDQLYYVHSVPEPGSRFFMGLFALVGTRSRARNAIAA